MTTERMHAPTVRRKAGYMPVILVREDTGGVQRVTRRLAHSTEVFTLTAIERIERTAVYADKIAELWRVDPRSCTVSIHHVPITSFPVPSGGGETQRVQENSGGLSLGIAHGQHTLFADHHQKMFVHECSSCKAPLMMEDAPAEWREYARAAGIEFFLGGVCAQCESQRSRDSEAVPTDPSAEDIAEAMITKAERSRDDPEGGDDNDSS